MNTINVLILEDQPMMLDALQNELGRDTNNIFKKIEKARNKAEFINKIIKGTIDYDVILMDYFIEETDGMRILKELESKKYKKSLPKIIFISILKQIRIINEIREAGFSFVSKDCSLKRLPGIITRVNEREQIVILPEDIDNSDFLASFNNLSGREKYVSFLMTKGYKAKEIAAVMGNVTDVINTYKANIKEKLDMSPIVMAVQMGKYGLDEKCETCCLNNKDCKYRRQGKENCGQAI